MKPHTRPAMDRIEMRRRWNPAEPTDVFNTYWKFAAERQSIFFKKAQGFPQPWTEDPILRAHKFTNAYRASDRVSQYLIRHVIYGGRQDHEEVFFRVILFKLFNRIDTWRLLVDSVGDVSWRFYSFTKYNKALSHAMATGKRLYSAAYMMPAGRSIFGRERKHTNHLKLLETMMADELPERMSQARSMREAFELIRSYPTIGDFLAYQYVTDLNYSTLMNFSEMDFVAAGPGARDGIRKCFSCLGGLNDAEIIKLVADRQDEEFSLRGIAFQRLWGRRLQLIDCQNLFCEVDKYARVAHPDVPGISGRSRIKQKYHSNGSLIDYWFPPKWGLNDAIQAWRRRLESL